MQRSPLHASHRALGARFTEFAGWEMPVQYEGLLAEHARVRGAVGLFDVSHMGEIEVSGPDALALCQDVATNDAARLAVGTAQYTIWCDATGGTIDDTILYRTGEQRYFFCVNASNAATCAAWINERAARFPGARVIDRTAELGLVAVQGPSAVRVVTAIGAPALGELPKFGCVELVIAGVPILAGRTGYTGEDGFELFAPIEETARIWDALLAAARPLGGGPIGLGARDTLRLEAGMALYGHELSREISPLEASLGWAVKLDKDDFCGRDALRQQKAAGLRRRLVGLRLTGPGIARGEYPVVADGREVGVVTSGTRSPTLGVSIALALIEKQSLDASLAVRIRGRDVPAERVSIPFYRRPGAGGTAPGAS